VLSFKNRIIAKFIQNVAALCFCLYCCCEYSVRL